MDRRVLDVKFVGVEPTRGSLRAAAYDLYANEDITILPGEVKTLGTGTFIEMEEDCEGLLNVRSSIGNKGIMLANGTGIIDADYRGELKMSLYNGNIKPLLLSIIIGSLKGIKARILNNDGSINLDSISGILKINKGERIGQLRVRLVPDVNFHKVDFLSDTERGNGGFGSTGV